jgi:hypothetical protein
VAAEFADAQDSGDSVEHLTSQMLVLFDGLILAESGLGSVCRRLLHMINDINVHRSLALFQFQSECIQ